MKYAILMLFVSMAAFARDDLFWFNLAVNAEPWKNGVLLHFDQEIEFDNSKLMDEETYMSAGYRLCPYASIFVGHRIVRERYSTVQLRTEQRPTVDLYLYAPEFWTIRLSHRSRFEYRDKKGVRPYMRYRERFQVGTSWSFSDMKFSPYANIELFFSDKYGVRSSEAFDCTRSQAGLSFLPAPCVPELSCTMYFMAFHYVSNGARVWRPINTYGLSLGYSF
ncbi:MAG: DUF2490 domain-containing protein [Kiritimatiellae bacterium]|nr:DUF2490 domain-containing protein [Kiritimatiellia bacterium]